jgi:hypothetical protein
MKLNAFHGRFAGLVSLGRTVGILLIIINLAAAFVLERYRIAHAAIEVEELEREVRLLHKKLAHLQSKTSNLESLEHIASVAQEAYSFRLPHPDQIVWLADSCITVRHDRSVIRDALDRLDYLYASLRIPGVDHASAVAGERMVK